MSQFIFSCCLLPCATAERLDKALLQLMNYSGWPELQSYSRTAVQRLIALGNVVVNGKKLRSAKLLKSRVQIELCLPLLQPSLLQPVAIPLEILYEDDALLVVNKPAPLMVHPGAHHAVKHPVTLVQALLAYTPKLSQGWQGIGGIQRPGIVHRLDQGTTGAIVVAKDDSTHRYLAQQFASRQVYKQYHAIVKGEVQPRSGQIRTLLARHSHHRQRFTSRTTSGKHAATDYQVLAVGQRMSLLQLQLHTGRTHQIRVHLAEVLGHPVVGDTLYGHLPANALIAHQALHSSVLAFRHPNGEMLRVTAPWPAAFQQLAAILSS